MNEEGQTVESAPPPRRVAGAAPALWKLAVGRLMGWTPEQGRMIEATLRERPVDAARAIAEGVRDFVGDLLGEEKRDAG